MDLRNSSARLKSRGNTDSGGITHNVHVWGKGDEQTLRFSLTAELENYFPGETRGCAAPVPCSSECFQEVNLGTSAHHTTRLSPGEEIPRLRVLVNKADQTWEARTRVKWKKAYLYLLDFPGFEERIQKWVNCQEQFQRALQFPLSLSPPQLLACLC